jgi:hypothetical protein
MKKVHHICVETRHKETCWKLLNYTGKGKKGKKCSKRGLHWLKYNARAGIILRQTFHWPTNINNEGHKWKQDALNGGH